MLGVGRIIGDTAIIVLLLGATLQLRARRVDFPILDTLRGTGSTLTSYVYQNAPTGEANQPTKAYAAAFVLLSIVLILNAVVDVVRRRARKAGSMEFMKPPPVRRLASTAPRGDARLAKRRVRERQRQRHGSRPSAFAAAPRRRIGAPQLSIARMQVEDLSIAYGGKLAVN